jgi:excinuclease UvrABC nuclease subunit
MSKEIQFTGKLNGKGDLSGVISLLESGKLQYEDVTNLSKAPERARLTELFKDTYLLDDAEQKILQVMQKTRSELENSSGGRHRGKRRGQSLNPQLNSQA